MEPMGTQVDEGITDQELMQFGETLIEVQEIQMEANQQINETIGNASITGERLDEIFVLQQENPAHLEQEVSQEELDEFSQVMTKISKIQQTYEIEIVNSLEENSYNVESFNRMVARIQEDPELLNRLQTLFSNQQEGI